MKILIPKNYQLIFKICVPMFEALVIVKCYIL